MANNAALFVSPAPLVDGNGHVYALGQLFFYVTGTSTPLNTWSDSGLSSLNANPVVADANGVFGPIYMTANTSYKVVLETSAGATVWTRDPVQGVNINVTPSVGLLRSYLAGLTLSNNGTTPNTKLDVAIGACADDTNVLAMSVVAGTIDCTTTGVNGLDTGALANSTWYHAYAVAKVDGTTALLASTSASSPTMPTGYTLKRRIGGFKTDGSAHILAFTQTGDLFQWATPIVDFNASSIASATPTSKTMSVPTGSAMTWVGCISGLNTGINGTTFTILAYTPGKATAVAMVSGGTSGTTTNTASAASYGQILTNSSAQITLNPTYFNTLTIVVETQGWLDRRGRDS